MFFNVKLLEVLFSSFSYSVVVVVMKLGTIKTEQQKRCKRPQEYSKKDKNKVLELAVRVKKGTMIADKSCG